LAAREIETRPIWTPMRLQIPYRAAPRLGGDVAVELYERVLCLPCYAHLTPEQQDEVIAVVTDVVRRG
jgi:dTDP-4-amino-4,6-dideoxygalactose transaminase